jgi:hypothetical protein
VEHDGLVLAGTNSTGDGGSIDVDFDRVILRDGGSIGVGSQGDGADAGLAGSLTIRARDLFRSEDSSVTTESVASDGGDILISAGRGVELFNSSITAEVGGGPDTTGGNITIDPDWVILEDGSRIRANAYEGQGGNIDITTKGLFVSADSKIDASSELGVSGTVQVSSPETYLSGSLAPLSDRYLEEVELRRERCAPDAPLPSLPLEGDRP